MGYSHSLATIQKNQRLLAPLLKGGPVVTWYPTQDQDLHSIAYKLRECRYIARNRRAEVPKLAAIFDEYEVKVNHRRNCVEAIRISEPMELEIEIVPIVETRATRIKYATSSAQVIQEWLNHEPMTAPLIFEQAVLPDEDLGEVIRWASSIEPPWIVIQEGDRLTIKLEGVSS